MTTYWCVNQRYYDNGKVESCVRKVESDEAFKDGVVTCDSFDEYNDYFNSHDEAIEFYHQSLRV